MLLRGPGGGNANREVRESCRTRRGREPGRPGPRTPPAPPLLPLLLGRLHSIGPPPGEGRRLPEQRGDSTCYKQTYSTCYNNLAYYFLDTWWYNTSQVCRVAKRNQHQRNEGPVSTMGIVTSAWMDTWLNCLRMSHHNLQISAHTAVILAISETCLV